MKLPPSLPPPLFERAFPFYLALDDGLRIRACGPVLRRLLPTLIGNCLHDAFEPLHPVLKPEIEVLLQHQDSALILRARALPELRLRAQPLLDPASDLMLLLCTPWLDVSADLSALGLAPADFAAHDGSTDYLAALRAVRQSLIESQHLNEALQQSRKALADRNDQLQAARDALDLRVEARAAELALTNSALRVEIVEHKRTESELRRAHEELRSIIDTAFDAYIALDAEGRVLEWNSSAERMFGWLHEDVLHQDLATLIVPERHRQAHRDGLLGYRRDGDVQATGRRMEFNARRHDGSEIPVELVVWASRGQGGLRFNAFLHDISERRRAAQALHAFKNRLEQRVEERTRELVRAKAEAEEASRTKSAFLATMSHEIRTPMNGVLGMIEVLAESSLAAGERDAIETIRGSAQSLLRLLDDILDFSKIEAGRLELEREPLALGDLAESACRALLPVAFAREVDLDVFVDPELPNWIWGDTTRLRQILTNLLSNAIKFSGGRSGVRGRVAVRLQPDPLLPDRLRLAVRDNGIGMNAEAQARLFTPFAQGEASTTRRFGGSGLGLAICKRLVDLMDGEIVVASTAGAGTTVEIRLPLEPLDEDSDPALPSLEGICCLILEESDLPGRDFAAILRAAGADVRSVADLSSAALALASASAGAVPVMVRCCGHLAPTPACLAAASTAIPNLCQLILRRGRRQQTRSLGPGIVELDCDALARAGLLHAVLAVAGRDRPPPPALARESESRPAREVPSVAAARAESRLILVAEDDEVNQKVVLRQLALLGYAAEVADNGAQALRLWRCGGHGLLLSDLHMPELDGYGLVAAVRREESGRAPIPILALTANALSGEAQRARQAGFDEYLTKPIQLAQLRDALQRWLPLPNTPRAAPAADRAPPLQVNVLRELVGEDPDTIQELLRDFQQVLQRDALAIQQAAESGDSNRVGDIAHRLKSSSRSVGALFLGDLCAELQNAGRNTDGSQVATHLQRFGEEAARVQLALARHIQG